MDKANGNHAVRDILNLADVQINGSRPWDIQVGNPSFYETVLSGGSLALGETYMAGWWNCEGLDQFFYKIMHAKLDKKAKKSMQALWAILKAKITNVQNRSKAYEIGKWHYDIGNDLFSIMLDKGMNYSCGYWKNAEALDQAQEAKLDLICRKMDLKPGMKVLDIGCGWGGFAKYAAEKYRVRVLGVTVSREQVKFARNLCKGLPVDIKFQDYRNLKEEKESIVANCIFKRRNTRRLSSNLGVN